MFKNIWAWLSGLFKDAAKMLEKPAEIVNKIVNVIKDYVFSGAVDLITALTRTGIDNEIVERIRHYFPGILAGLMKAENIIKDVANGSMESVLRLFADYIGGISKEARGKWWVELAAVLLNLVTGKDVHRPLAITVTQATYLKNAA